MQHNGISLDELRIMGKRKSPMPLLKQRLREFILYSSTDGKTEIPQFFSTVEDFEQKLRERFDGEMVVIVCNGGTRGTPSLFEKEEIVIRHVQADIDDEKDDHLRHIDLFFEIEGLVYPTYYDGNEIALQAIGDYDDLVTYLKNTYTPRNVRLVRTVPVESPDRGTTFSMVVESNKVSYLKSTLVIEFANEDTVQNKYAGFVKKVEHKKVFAPK